MGKAEREWRGEGCWLEATVSDVEVAEELVEYIVNCCAVQGSWETTVAGKLVTVNFFHGEQ